MEPTPFYHPLWPVLYEDNHLLVLYKPAGLLVQGDRTGDVSLLDLGKQWLKTRYSKPGQAFLGLVHRLDRPVAGVVVFAKTSKAAGRISEQFRNKSVSKIYLAVAQGKFRKSTGMLENYLLRDKRLCRIAKGQEPGARIARLTFQVLDTKPDHSLLRLKLETGRKHQIRLQLAHIGHPIMGDRRYGAASSLSHNQIALLASELSVDHPTRPERLTFRSPIPDGWLWPDPEDRPRNCPWCWEILEPLIHVHGTR